MASNQRGEISKIRDEAKGLQIKFLRSIVLYLFIETIIFHEFKS